jgi:integrase
MPIEDFLNELKINGVKESTLKYYGYMLHNADEYKPIDTWKKDDVNKFILSLKNKPSTIEIKKILLKEYFEWLGKSNIVEHLRIKLPKKQLKREEILSPEDISKMIESTYSHMYKSLIALLFESGGRISEVLPITVGEIEETNKGMVIPIHGTKTGEIDRRVLCILSDKYIRNHISYSALKKEDLLFPFSRSWANTMIQKIAKDAGIEKPVTCHKLRHAQATDMVVRGYQEGIIRKKLGWTDDSSMISRYTHLVDEDVINATYEKNGQEISKQPIVNVKTAEPLNIVEAGAQLKQLKDKNEELEQQVKFILEMLDGTVDHWSEEMKQKMKGKKD